MYVFCENIFNTKKKILYSVMSVFDGEIEFKSVYMVDFVKKDKP